jgi:DNA-binding PadR family transcriptional regulator
MARPSGSLRHIILGRLRSAPTHGYGLRQAAARQGWIYPVTNSAVYPALHELEQEGLVTVREEIRGGRARKIYSITDAGTAALYRWLVDETPQKLRFRDTLLLKISMMGDEAMHQASSWIEEGAAELREQIDKHERSLKDREIPKYTRLAMEYGIDLLRLRLRFLEQVLDAAGHAESPTGPRG